MTRIVNSLYTTRWPQWIAIVILAKSAICFAQTNINVPPGDPAYLYLDNLKAWGLINSDFPGTKPFTRVEFARLILEAQTNLQNRTEVIHWQLVKSSLEYLSNEFSDSIRYLQGSVKARTLTAKPFDSLKLEYMTHNSPARFLPAATIDAEIQPFTAYEEGRKYLQGKNIALESSHWLAFGETASFYYQGRVIFTDPENSLGIDNELDYETLRMYFQFTKWNINLLVGKDGMVWGMGSRGNLILSPNANPIGSFNTLPLIKVSNRLPIRLPLIFRSLGPMRYEIFVSRLEGDRRDFTRPYFIGNRFNFKSSKNFEYGLSHTYILGGNGFPNSITFFDALAEFFFIRIKQNFIFNIGIGEVTLRDNIANHVMGFDFRLRLPKLHNLEFYNEFYFDDMTFNLHTTLTRNLAYYGGFFLPRLTGDGRFNLRLEFTHTSTIFYTGTPPLTSGFTFNDRILGNELGPFGNEVFAEINFKANANTTWSSFIDFQTRGVGKETGPEFIGLPDEKRVQFGGRLTKYFKTNLAISLEARYQRVESFANLAGDNRNSYFGGLTVRAEDIF